MQRADLQPDVGSYALLFNAYGKARREEEALYVLRRCWVRGQVGSFSCALILLIGHRSNLSQASYNSNNVLPYCLHFHRPTLKAYNILLDAFAVSGMVEQARTVFKSMRSDRCTPDLCSYTTMLSAYVDASDMYGADKFFRRIKQDSLSPNEVTYGALIKGYAKENDLEKMMASMKKCGVPA